MTELNEEVNFHIEQLDEAAGGGKKYRIEGIFMQSGIQNRNGRVYPTEVLENEVKRYSSHYIDKNRAYGELGHPSGPTINLERTSHMITSLKREGKNFVGSAKILPTPMGNIVKNLMDSGATLGVSSRGIGSLKVNREGINEVQKDFQLATPADIVADPSAPDAFVQGIMEGKQWVWENGILKEFDIAEMYDEIKQASSKDLQEQKLRVFRRFMRKLSK
tara:strand:+ start:1545 stop:2201 length:657 start_codon:yes stop_codon:yes gene_type:complete